jgi:hypothetical protein
MAAVAAVPGRDVRERVGARVPAPGAAELQAANSTTTAAMRDLKAGCFKNYLQSIGDRRGEPDLQAAVRSGLRI